MSEYGRILVTSALPYVNGPIHLGHLVGAYLPADVFCRYHRMRGQDVLYICGSDEHGVPIMLQARAQGVDPQEIVDHFHGLAKSAFDAIGMSFDHYGRTSAPIHRETSQDWFKKLAADGAFKLKTSTQLYDPEAKLFLADRLIEGTCPKPGCGYEHAFGDQCEKCGSALSPKELINPRSTITNATPEERETTHWYLPLGDLQERIEAWIATKSDWKPNVLGQINSWLTGGLADRAMTRDLPWGVPVPEEVGKAAGVSVEGKVLYVWFDAPIGYISSTRQWAAEQGDPEAWRAYWEAEDTRLVHFIGKDNIVFHTIIFPALMMLHGDVVLPENVPANEFLNLEGKKLSTSRGWAVWLAEALEDFEPDYLRYALIRSAPETKDSDFSWSEFASHVNNELADNLGNFVNRTLAFVTKYVDGKVPQLLDPSAEDLAVLEALKGFPERIGGLIDSYRLRDGIQELLALSRLGNKYFNDAAPWATRKTDLRLCGNTLHVSLQLCASLSILAEPFLPHIAANMRRQLQLVGVRSSMPNAGADAAEFDWDRAATPLLAAGHVLGAPEVLVRKVDEATVAAQRAKLEARAAEVEAEAAAADAPFAPLGEECTFDDFCKVDLRVGRVTLAERVKKSKKLLRCEVDLGFESRQVLAGVAEHIAPEELVGQSVVVVVNLKPRKMMGLLSHGMFLMAKDRRGRLFPAQAEGEPGSTVA